MATLRRVKLRQSEIKLLVLIIFLPFIFSVSASFYVFSDSYVQWLRLLTVVFIIIFLSVLKTSELLMCLKLYGYVALILALISTYQFIVGYPVLEKFPLINLFSNKSIIFEQNVYGLFLYMNLLLFSVINSAQKNWQFVGTISILLFGILISFYRTIYAALILFVFFKHPIKTIIGFSLIIFLTPDWAFVGEVLKFDQLESLTGRDILWLIALDSFYEAPLIGLGEGAIPDVTNMVLNRESGYTTYHNVIFDLLAISGIIGLLLWTITMVVIYKSIANSHRVIFLLLMIPALSNTYFAFMPNPLGGILGAFIFYSIRINQDMKVQEGVLNGRR